MLLITRRSKQGVNEECWTIPAGKVEGSKDTHFRACALREVLEEAGVECEYFADLGWMSSRNKHGGPISTRFFLAQCVKELPTWLEDDTRTREWFTLDEAMELLSYREDLASVVEEAARILNLAPRSISKGSSLERSSSHGTLPQSTSTNVGQASARETFDMLRTQVGGHTCMLKPARGTFLEFEPMASTGETITLLGDSLILKSLDKQEFDSYDMLQRRNSALSPFLVPILGTKRLSTEDAAFLAQLQYERQLQGAHHAGRVARKPPGEFKRFLVMADLGHQMQAPAFLDVKMGCFQRSVRSWAKPEKRAKKIAKSIGTTTSTLGFRLCGMGQFSDEGAEKFDKYQGQKVAAPGMLEALAKFFCFEPAAMEALLGALVDELARMQEAVEDSPGWRFWSSSVLIGFDAAATEDPRALVTSLKVYVIDLAHFAEVQGPLPDTEFLVGLRNLQAHLITLRDYLEGDMEEAARALEARLVRPPPPELQEEEEARLAELSGYNVAAVPRFRSPDASV